MERCLFFGPIEAEEFVVFHFPARGQSLAVSMHVFDFSDCSSFLLLQCASPAVHLIVVFSPRLYYRHLHHSRYSQWTPWSYRLPFNCGTATSAAWIGVFGQFLCSFAHLVHLKVPGSSNQKLDASPVPCRGLVSSHIFILEAFCLNLLQRIRPFTSMRRQATIAVVVLQDLWAPAVVAWSEVDKSIEVVMHQGSLAASAS